MPVRPTFIQSDSDGIKLGRRLGAIDHLKPVVWFGNGPWRKPVAMVGAFTEASPWPGFSLIDEPGAQGVAFHVSTDLQEVSVLRDSYGTVTPLIDGTLPYPSLRQLPSPRMGHRQPVHEPSNAVATGH